MFINSRWKSEAQRLVIGILRTRYFLNILVGFGRISELPQSGFAAVAQNSTGSFPLDANLAAMVGMEFSAERKG